MSVCLLGNRACFALLLWVSGGCYCTYTPLSYLHWCFTCPPTRGVGVCYVGSDSAHKHPGYPCHVCVYAVTCMVTATRCCPPQDNNFYEKFKRRIEIMKQNSLYHVTLPPKLEFQMRRAGRACSCVPHTEATPPSLRNAHACVYARAPAHSAPTLELVSLVTCGPFVVASLPSPALVPLLPAPCLLASPRLSPAVAVTQKDLMRIRLVYLFCLWEYVLLQHCSACSCTRPPSRHTHLAHEHACVEWSSLPACPPLVCPRREPPPPPYPVERTQDHDGRLRGGRDPHYVTGVQLG
jgi:hypothetical protein